eukprot:5171248-Alexandrium_andersonii.AAC.1
MASPSMARPARGHERLQNLRVTSVDTAHAARRILKRAWGADEFLKDAADLFVFDSASFAQAMFQKSVEAMERDVWPH